MTIGVGTAGWAIPRDVAAAFPGGGTHLERYAAVLPVVEINSSFHRPHRRSTYGRWAASTPPDFRFSVKVPKAISHVAKLVGAGAALDAFFDQANGLESRFGVVLLQLPPKLAFDADVAPAFLADLRDRAGDIPIACEPRHASWFTAEVEACLAGHRIARAAADPVLVPGGERPGGWDGLRYHRLHGSPRVYYSTYGTDRLDTLAATLDAEVPTWCVFDNTASGAATTDALALRTRLSPGAAGSP